MEGFNHICTRNVVSIRKLPSNRSHLYDMSTSQANQSSDDHPACFTDTHGIITTTMNDIPGYRIVRVLGTVYGLTVRVRNWGVDIGVALRSAAGGEMRSFTKLMYTARNAATERMIGECMSKGGNAIVAMRYDASDIKIYSQVCAYGTACVIERV